MDKPSNIKLYQDEKLYYGTDSKISFDQSGDAPCHGITDPTHTLHVDNHIAITPTPLSTPLHFVIGTEPCEEMSVKTDCILIDGKLATPDEVVAFLHRLAIKLHIGD